MLGKKFYLHLELAPAQETFPVPTTVLVSYQQEDTSYSGLYLSYQRRYTTEQKMKYEVTINNYCRSLLSSSQFQVNNSSA